MIAIYVRVSTDEQRKKGLSLPEQKRRGVRFVTDEVKDKFTIYEDGGRSGTIHHTKRNGTIKLFKNIKQGKVDAIYVTAWDRLSRGSQSESEEIIRKLRAKKVKLFISGIEYNLEDETQRFILNMHQLIGSLEIAKISKRIKNVLRDNLIDGKSGGGPIVNYGYTKDSNKKLIIDGEEANVVKMIFKLALAGKGTKAISTILNEKNIPTKRANISKARTLTINGEKITKFKWRDTVVYRILTNPIYIGYRNINTYGEDENGKKIILHSELIHVPIEPIIDEATFELIQSQLKDRDNFKDTTTRYHYLLKGIVYCGNVNCGRKFVGKKRANGKDNSYSCNSSRYSEHCGNRGISIDYLDKLVCDSIKELDEIVLHAFEIIEADKENIRGINRLKKLEKQKNDIEKRIGNLLDKLELGEDVDTRLNNRKLERSHVDEKIEILKKQIFIINDEGDKEEVLEVARTAIKTFNKIRKFEAKREFIRSIVDSVYVFYNDGNYDIDINFKINQIQNYLIAKKVTVDRNSRKNGKAFTKILNESYDIHTTFYYDEENGDSERLYSNIHYSGYDDFSIKPIPLIRDKK